VKNGAGVEQKRKVNSRDDTPPVCARSVVLAIAVADVRQVVAFPLQRQGAVETVSSKVSRGDLLPSGGSQKTSQKTLYGKSQ
jgi:hypothetical protein